MPVQHRYAGDIGDFGKFESLKALSAAGFDVGVNWCCTQQQFFEAQEDGKYHIPRAYFPCDLPLAETLSGISHPPSPERTVTFPKSSGTISWWQQTAVICK